MSTPAVLALEDGTVFRGVSVGAKGNTTGEVVFNTAMTGYQEILTDPSYCRQIVTLTYPHVGNTGTTPEDLESGAVYAAGLVIRDLPLLHSNWRATESLGSFLLRCKVVAIADIDTRKLTRLLREKGAQSGCIMTGDNIDEKAAVRAAGIEWRDYDRFMQQWIKRADSDKVTKVPLNLDLTPYLDEKDNELIKVMQRAMVR